MLDFGFYNMDCMQGMKEFPDNYFDLAIVDPPYGAGFTEGGGCKGWFTKYHQNTEAAEKIGGVSDTTDLEIREVYLKSTNEKQLSRTGGTCAEKYGKKSYRGTQPRKENTLKNSFVSHEIK